MLEYQELEFFLQKHFQILVSRDLTWTLFIEKSSDFTVMYEWIVYIIELLTIWAEWCNYVNLYGSCALRYELFWTISPYWHNR